MDEDGVGVDPVRVADELFFHVVAVEEGGLVFGAGETRGGGVDGVAGDLAVRALADDDEVDFA